MKVEIYLISFKDKNDIYIGQTTQGVFVRLKCHFSEDLTVRRYIENNNIDKSNVYIDIIDTIHINDDLSSHDKRIIIAQRERFHICQYKYHNKYKLINKVIPDNFNYQIYDSHYNPNTIFL